MRTYTKSEVKVEKYRIHNKIHSGQIFVYPTDTIYGIGCNALDDEAVKKVRDVKKSENRPYGIIAPSKEWIRNNCEVPAHAEEWLNRLPGPYTLYLKLKNPKAVSRHVNPRDENKIIGVRMPDHWIQKMIAELNVPIITPPANVIGKNFMTSLENLDSDLKKASHFAIYEGEKKGKPSKVIKLHE
tara:strand:+ start:9990 stop:10544 length:555 start_codon:yes stop_codon:yes gene_type:complete